VARLEPGGVGVTAGGFGVAPDARRRALGTAVDLLVRAGATPDSLLTLLTADVAPTDSEVIHEENKLALHRYEPAERRHRTPVFLVYALVNRPYILDLQADRSVVRQFLDAGFVVYLLDWGEPSRLDSSLTMADYVDRYLDNAVDAACADAGVERVHLLGYCMGGSMAVMYAALDDERVQTLGLLATPVAFDGDGGLLERWATHCDPAVVVETLGNVPAELLAVEFSLLDPVDQYVTKYVHLLENLDDEASVATFARMEQWIWDGVDVAGEAYREFVTEVYRENRLVRGEYELDGRPVRPGDIEVPVVQVVGEDDHIVPPASSTALLDRLGSEDTRLVEFPRGHVGLSVSRKAHADLWPAVCDWFAERDAPAAAEGAGPDAADRDPADRPVESVEGIGPTYAGRLREAGIESRGELAAHDVQLLAALTDAPSGRVADWLEQV
jgi:polyhydroxyalkanoate synthase